MRPTRYPVRIKTLIWEVLNEFKTPINEIFDREIKTQADVIFKKLDIFDAEIYRFQTNSGTSYDLEFIFTNFFTDETIKGEKGSLSDMFNFDGIKQGSIDIAFSTTEVAEKEFDHDTYTQNTNKNEQIELMGRIQYLIKKFKKTYKEIDVYVVGKTTHPTKLKMYLMMFNNIFSNEFVMVDAENRDYGVEGSYYFVKKQLLRSRK